MPEHAVRVILSAHDEGEVALPGTLRVFTPSQRLARAGVVMVVAVLLAGSLLPIPIIHLIGPPIILVTGVVMAMRQLGAAVRLAPMKVNCPKCGYGNRIGGGLGWHDADQPMEHQCESCRRSLMLRVEADQDRPAST
jgi:hypothetical protein